MSTQQQQQDQRPPPPARKAVDQEGPMMPQQPPPPRSGGPGSASSGYRRGGGGGGGGSNWQSNRPSAYNNAPSWNSGGEDDVFSWRNQPQQQGNIGQSPSGPFSQTGPNTNYGSNTSGGQNQRPVPNKQRKPINTLFDQPRGPRSLGSMPPPTRPNNRPPAGTSSRWNNLDSETPNHTYRNDGTWATREGRAPFHEREAEVFKGSKDKKTGINFDSYDTIEVEVSGNRTSGIEPLTSFRTAADMPEALAVNIARVRYDRPTPVQKHAIPIILAGRDLMACAQTGSGKTAAFLFPIIIKMLKAGPPATFQRNYRFSANPVALVLSPTRELTCQIYEESRKFCFQTGIRTVVVYGGAEISAQFTDLKRGCDICVATPGRLNDILERGRISLAQVNYLVLDEADRMLDMGFAPQIHQIVSTKDMPTSSAGRQTAMFSATFPKEIQQLARDFLLDYVYLTVGRVGSTNEFITQKLVYADEQQKPKMLLSLLKESAGRVLVFVETKKKADVIEDYLCHQGLAATSIHGDRSQAERTRALELFKNGKCPILVATDVAARGLDIHSITWVINLDLPHNIEDYVHRIGRTGRAGNSGLATSFVNETNRPVVRELLRLLEETNQEIPAWFVDLTRACSHATTRFGGPNRYGGGARRGNFGGVDIRNFEGSDRRTFNAGVSSPRGMSGGRNGGGRGGYGSAKNSSTSGMAPVRTQHYQQPEDDCW
eukprot:Protomagalhaensia_sp_Gyna_25__3158@NODE_288_length_4041_cov_58_999250_g222_i0_p1_GENE_NODE_288_length_4041_cov_58_999250_g222_i0NODE_288_length_4041_cov_58_999250_g222_i0_p1_ORF_typecomplete_len715_score106_75DEAD/PF00270_29/5_3e54DEAD/PF00270_29/4Helicase_C/PF00271_31/1_8e03Helicase_C/PF00271_31/5_8e33ResIII/PF04851_15/7_3e11ERCC3_RAD25_C/PF16203_5/4_2e10CMS1/PF14617_6/0_00019UTP25/PF06862_12/0_0011T4SSDNA_transf/PF02534_14/0_14Helicase_C_4/PF13871_6/0_3_NODE_288_length_4041_cov_58_999250_g222_